MRTDVRLGLAVGTFLFVGVMVYVLFFTGKDGKPAANASQTHARVISPDVGSEGTKPDARATETPSASHAPAPETGRAITTDTTSSSHDSGLITPSRPDPSVASSSNTPLEATPSAPTGPASPTPDATSSTNTGTENSSTTSGHSTESAIASGGTTSSGTSNWQSLLENGAPDATHSVTPPIDTVRSRGGSDTNTTTPGTIVPPALDHTAPATQPSAGMRQYKIKPGETFWSIAKSEYGNASYFSHIVRANPQINPSRVKAGMTINLPAKEDVIPAASATVATSIAGPTTRPIDPAKEYKVKSGDNLNIICKKLYGNTAKVKQLYDLNKELIGPNPNALKLNSVLKLPDVPSATASSTSEEAAPAQ